MTHDLQNILDKFTYHFKKVLIHAQNLALAKKQNYIEPIDILISLVQTKGALGSEILIKQKLDPKFLPPRQFTFDHTLAVDPDKLPQPSETAQQIIEKAVVTAFKNQHKYIGTEHLLWGITESDDQEVHKIWQKTDINIKNIQQHLNLILQNQMVQKNTY